MIVGTGLIARAFAPHLHALSGVCAYAAGVSNSSCEDPREFEREKHRLLDTIAAVPSDLLFLYFSTCSIEDASAQQSAYVQHKVAMEHAVAQCERYLILRLPQLAGYTPNPHTLLNHLYSRIVRSERFRVWRGASRNIIDVEDVARIATDLVLYEGASRETINIANTHSFSVLDIVKSMEAVLGHTAIFDIIERGSGYTIDTNRIQAALCRCGISFSEDYLPRIVRKYYGRYNEWIST